MTISCATSSFHRRHAPYSDSRYAFLPGRPARAARLEHDDAPAARTFLRRLISFSLILGLEAACPSRRRPTLQIQDAASHITRASVYFPGAEFSAAFDDDFAPAAVPLVAYAYSRFLDDDGPCAGFLSYGMGSLILHDEASLASRPLMAPSHMRRRYYFDDDMPEQLLLGHFEMT